MGRLPAERFLRGIVIRLCQVLARFAPGGRSLRVTLHRMRGVRIGRGCFIGSDVIIETAHPERIQIGDGVVIGIRTLILGHFDPAEIARGGINPQAPTVRIEDGVFIGPGVIILPNVRIGEGSVITAGSVVSRSIPPHTVARGNPAQPIGRCRVPLRPGSSIWDFYAGARSLPGEERK